MTAALTALRLWAEVDASIDTAVMTESPEQAAPRGHRAGMLHGNYRQSLSSPTKLGRCPVGAEGAWFEASAQNTPPPPRPPPRAPRQTTASRASRRRRGRPPGRGGGGGGGGPARGGGGGGGGRRRLRAE